ncbi:MAG: LUD domain-containing protein, partial [Candidatus Aminicenantes bacterium]
MPINKKFRKKIKNALDNPALRNALGNFAQSYPQARENAYKGINFEHLRDQIEKIKTTAIQNIKELARQFEEKVTERGGKVYRAADGQEVTNIIKEIARQRNARLCVKSKSMATEEIHLNHRLKDVLKVVETDLGEWIVQQIDEPPSHMVMPAIHLTKEKCADIFSKAVGEEVQPDIPHMVKLARKILRAEFLAADIGITGCNIAVAETGTMVIFTNEGNGRLTTSLPPVHIVVLGYEKLVPRFKDIGPLAAAIPRSATCQYLTSYVTMITAPSDTFKGPNREDIVPKELHVILLDNGRLELLANPVFKNIGQCIRCASCLNVCPVYGLVGGQVYGHVYAGGIGTLLTAFLSSPQDAEKIQELCLNCGKCRETCPGKIDIPGLILELRSYIRGQIPPPFLHKIAIEKVLPHKKMFDISIKTAAPGMRLFSFRHQLPSPAPKTFRSVFKTINQEILQPKGTIAFFYGCLIDYLYPEIGESIVFLLNRAGYRVILPGQHCCGAPAIYMGLEKSAKKMAEENLLHLADDTANYDYIVTACPTGTVMLKKHWQHCCKDDPAVLARAKTAADKTMDFIQLVYLMQKQGAFLTGSGSLVKEINITYHYSCHLKRECGIETEPGEVLSVLPGVNWLEMDEADRCCGFAGSYSMKLPEISAELLAGKIKNIEKSGAEIVVVDCPGCLLWLRRGLQKTKSKIQVLHSAVFLAQRSGRRP